ncbi:TPA: DUF362 domain-containing protein [bacterium]|nr:DUF362 domain-containing protein [bacterium]
MNKSQKIERREFIKDMSLIGLGLAFGTSLIPQKAFAQNKSRIVVATHDDVVNGIRINRKIAKQLVNAGIMQYTGQNTVAEAWAKVLPSLSSNDIVTIKINCINSSLPSHPEIIDAITTGLISAGVRDNNIIIWDRTNHEILRAGYIYNAGKVGIRFFGSDERGWGYDKQIKVGDKNVRLSRLISESKHIINVPVLKDHGIVGVTLSMKNHYGSIDNPGILHDNGCDPYIAELNNIQEIKEKTRLIVLDGLLGIYVGGPGGKPQFTYKSVIIGQDPVAMDYNGWKIIETERKKHNLELTQPSYIKTSANLGLGTNDPDNIIIENINLRKHYTA